MFREKEKENDEYTVVVYGFVWDAKFIDFAYDKSGIIFSKDIYELDEVIIMNWNGYVPLRIRINLFSLVAYLGGVISLTDRFLKSYVTLSDLKIIIGEPQLITAPSVLALQCIMSLPQFPLSTNSATLIH